MSTTASSPPSANLPAGEIPFYIKVTLPCVAAALLVFVATIVFVYSCNKKRRCCRKKGRERYDLGAEYAHLGQGSRRLIYPPQPTIHNSTAPLEFVGDRRDGIGTLERALDQDCMQNFHRENNQHTVQHGDAGLLVCQEPRLRECVSNGREHPTGSGFSNCESTLENALYARIPARRKSDGEVEAFQPGQKGYISMSSANRRPRGSCRSNTGYITPRPEHRRPVNVCHPLMSQPSEPWNTPDEPQQEENQFQLQNPIYERLNTIYRPGRKVESCPSSRHNTRRKDRGHYDSLPLLHLQMSAVEIPIGPFVTCEKRDHNLSETEDMIKHRKSFENLFEGAWWHSESDSESPPCLPHRQLRYSNTVLRSAERSTNQRPTSYVTMNRKSLHETHLRTGANGACFAGAATLPPPLRPHHDSYMTHGQQMKGRQLRGEEDTCKSSLFEDFSHHSLPPLPTPCARGRVYVNVKN